MDGTRHRLDTRDVFANSVSDTTHTGSHEHTNPVAHVQYVQSHESRKPSHKSAHKEKTNPRANNNGSDGRSYACNNSANEYAYERFVVTNVGSYECANERTNVANANFCTQLFSNDRVGVSDGPSNESNSTPNGWAYRTYHTDNF
jgi:hypothetical protein